MLPSLNQLNDLLDCLQSVAAPDRYLDLDLASVFGIVDYEIDEEDPGKVSYFFRGEVTREMFGSEVEWEPSPTLPHYTSDLAAAAALAAFVFPEYRHFITERVSAKVLPTVAIRNSLLAPRWEWFSAATPALALCAALVFVAMERWGEEEKSGEIPSFFPYPSHHTA